MLWAFLFLGTVFVLQNKVTPPLYKEDKRYRKPFKKRENKVFELRKQEKRAQENIITTVYLGYLIRRLGYLIR